MAWSRLPELLAWSQGQKGEGDAEEANKACPAACTEEGRRINNVISRKLLTLVSVSEVENSEVEYFT
jgi:hypothetical protein